MLIIDNPRISNSINSANPDDDVIAGGPYHDAFKPGPLDSASRAWPR